MTTTPPPPGRWLIDPTTATVGFSGRASRLAPVVAARFAGIEGAVHSAPDDARVEVTVDVRSMRSGNRAWDEVLAAVDPFDAERFPAAHYRSTSVRWSPGGAVVAGLLELRGVVRPVRLQVRHEPAGPGRLHVRAEGEVDRAAFGVTLDVPGAALLVPRRLRLAIDVLAVHDCALVAA